MRDDIIDMSHPAPPPPSPTTPAPWLEVLALPALLCLLGTVLVALRLMDGDVAVSTRENRPLAVWPTMSRHSIADGSWARDVDGFVADRFPCREQFLDLAAVMVDARGVDVRDEVYDGDALGDFGLDPVVGAVDGGVVDGGVVDAVDGGVGDAVDGGVVDAVDAVDGGAVDAGAPKTKRRYKSGIAIVGDRGLMYLVADDDSAAAFADVVNTWPDVVGPSVRLSLVVTPTATHYYLPAEQQDKSAPQDENLAVIRQRLRPEVHMVDVDQALAPHVDEPIFFRTDHHWTALGAYYAYAAWAKQEGFVPVELKDLEKRTHPPVLGSMHRFTQSKVLKAVPDPIDYWLPAVVYTGWRNRSLNEAPRPATFIVERQKNYAVFLGGDDPQLTATTTVKNGRRALLVKNSFGNAFAPFLLHHFEEVVVVDYRYYDRSLAALIKARGITDVILQNATVTANTRGHTARLRDALKGTGTAWETMTPEKDAADVKKFQEEHGIVAPKGP
jgi:hypothetical protein